MPENTPEPRTLARALTAAAAALLLVAGGLLTAAPANAHDELVSTDPAADSVLEALPDQLMLTFSGELATDVGATALQVTDAAGTSLADGAPVVEGTSVTQALAGAASGPITVLWKVVSSDGHPISGEYGFTVTAPVTPTPTPTASPTDSSTASPTEAPTAQPTEAPSAEPVPADSGSAALPWIIGALLLAALAAAVTYLLVSRARRQRAEEALRASAAEAAAGGRAAGSAPRSEPPADR
jgi:methionine-rich copper-binding protein CopC